MQFQAQMVMTQFVGLEDALSHSRFARYLQWASGDREAAILLYSLNVRLSEALYVPLHALEITLRNRIHAVMSQLHGDTWYDAKAHQVNPVQVEMLAKARADLADAHKADEASRVVAALTFGYWTAMLGREYENLWQQTLHAIARREDGKGLTRKNLATPLGRIRTLRNRIMHHEPILNWSLPKHHKSMIQVIGWLSPAAADWCKSADRFAEAYPSEGYKLSETVEAVELNNPTLTR